MCVCVGVCMYDPELSTRWKPWQQSLLCSKEGVVSVLVCVCVCVCLSVWRRVGFSL